MVKRIRQRNAKSACVSPSAGTSGADSGWLDIRPSGPTGVFLPESALSAGEKFRDGKLSLGSIAFSFSTVNQSVRPMLRSTSRDDSGLAALAELETTLKRNPFILVHPYVWATVRHLASAWWPAAEVQPGTPKPDEWLRRLVAAWVEGITFGYKVRITRRGREQRGQTPMLFPDIDDHDGYVLSERGQQDHRDAFHVAWLYRELMNRLKVSVKWKTLCREWTCPSFVDTWVMGHCTGALKR